MKKGLLRIFLAISVLVAVFSLTVGARTVYLLNENFENAEHGFVATALNGSKGEVSTVTEGTNNVLKYKQLSGYSHVGTPVRIVKDREYSFSFDIKMISYADGSAYASGKKISLNASFVFTDSMATNKKMNHVISLPQVPADGNWHTYEGKYTAKSTEVAADADVNNAVFAVYTNPESSKNHIFVIDNVKVFYTDDQPEDGVDYFKNGSFEDLSNIEIQSANGKICTIEPGDIDASDGIYSVKIIAPNYGHIGIPVKLEAGRTYDFSYDFKLIGDKEGNSTTTKVSAYANFVFPDSKASSGKNHLIVEKGVSVNSNSGWVHVEGSYTPDYPAIAADSDLENAYFTVYSNPVNNNGATWLIDNMSFVRRPVASAETNIVFPDIISDNMLVQMGEPIKIWGSFLPGKELTVTLYDNDTPLSTKTFTTDGTQFETELPEVNSYLKSGTIVVECDGEEIKTIENVAVGELWHFSGQSNMARKALREMPDLYPEVNMPDIRSFGVGTNGDGVWVVANITEIGNIGAVAYKTMETIYNGLGTDAPVGGINTAVGGKTMSNYTGVC